MQFESKNVPASSQKAVCTTLARAKWPLALAHVDDTSEYSESVTEHFVRVGAVAALLRGSTEFFKVRFPRQYGAEAGTHDANEKSGSV